MSHGAQPVTIGGCLEAADSVISALLTEIEQHDEKAFARLENPSGISDADPRGDDRGEA